MIQAFANPQAFMRLSAWATPVLGALAALTFALGLSWALIWSPADQLHGENVRIMYVHVPSAWWALGVYMFMAGASFVSLIWRHALADLAARAAAPVGAVLAGLCLATGSMWGARAWGTWWEWEGRLTSMLVLFVTYLGYLALWSAVEDEQKAARLAAILCLAGVINVPIVHFSVEWWAGLHQGPSVIREGGSAIHPSMLAPLLTMAAAYGLTFGALTLASMRALIYKRRVEIARARRAVQA